jgi:ATP-dependent Clp protease ATP-binding subunit ClpA
VWSTSTSVAWPYALQQIKLDVDYATCSSLAKKCLSDVYGERAIVRIMHTVLFPLAQKLLMGTKIWYERLSE